MSNRKQRKEIDKAIRNILNFVEQQPEWQQRLDEIFSQMLSPAAQSLGIEEDELVTEIQQAGCSHMVFCYVFEEFASVHWDNEERSFIDEYLKRRGWRETPRGRRYLQALNNSEVQLWEITAVKPGSYAEVRPYGTTQKSIKVIEKSATESLHQWDGLAARIIQMDNTPIFTGGLLPLPPTKAEPVQQILDKIKEKTLTLFEQFLKDGEIDALPNDLEQQAEDEANSYLPEILFRIWVAYLYQSINPAMPMLQNKDGDALQPTTVRFPITAQTIKITRALDDIPELDRNTDETVWTWFPCAADDIKEGEPVSVLGHIYLKDTSLELEVNSSERATTGRQWLTEKLEGLIGQPLTVYENLTDKIQNAKPMDPSMDLSHTAEGQALIKAHMDKHYQQTLDEPIPMLDDKTPRECAANPKLHKDVVQWLKYVENQSAQASSPHYDVSWIWEELGLEEYKSS